MNFDKLINNFIIFEGVDGTGTTTQSSLLYETLKDKFGYENIMWTCEPNSNVFGNFVREKLIGGTKSDRALIHGFFMDRYIHWEEEILPALNAGKTVICDRFLWSTFAYQSYKNEKLYQTIFNYSKELRNHDMVPNFKTRVIYLDAENKTLEERKNRRGKNKDVFDSLDCEKINQIKNTYEKCLKGKSSFTFSSDETHLFYDTTNIAPGALNEKILRDIILLTAEIT